MSKKWAHRCLISQPYSAIMLHLLPHFFFLLGAQKLQDSILKSYEMKDHLLLNVEQE